MSTPDAGRTFDLAGSRDDDGLNASVARYAADPGAVTAFGQDSDPDGMIGVPVLTIHAIDDPIAMVEFEDYFRKTMEATGQVNHLVQTFTDDHEHSYLADPDYPTLLNALMRWIDNTRSGSGRVLMGSASAEWASCMEVPAVTDPESLR